MSAHNIFGYITILLLFFTNCLHAQVRIVPKRTLFVIDATSKEAANEDLILEIDMAVTYARSEYDKFQLCRISKRNPFSKDCIDFNLQMNSRISTPKNAVDLHKLKFGKYQLIFTKNSPNRKVKSAIVDISPLIISNRHTIKVQELKETKMNTDAFKLEVKTHLRRIAGDFSDFMVETGIKKGGIAIVRSCSGKRIMAKYTFVNGKAYIWNVRKDQCFVLEIGITENSFFKWLGIGPKIVHRQYLNLPYHLAVLPKVNTGNKGLIFLIESKRKPDNRDDIQFMRKQLKHVPENQDEHKEYSKEKEHQERQENVKNGEHPKEKEHQEHQKNTKKEYHKENQEDLKNIEIKKEKLDELKVTSDIDIPPYEPEDPVEHDVVSDQFDSVPDDPLDTHQVRNADVGQEHGKKESRQPDVDAQEAGTVLNANIVEPSNIVETKHPLDETIEPEAKVKPDILDRSSSIKRIDPDSETIDPDSEAIDPDREAAETPSMMPSSSESVAGGNSLNPSRLRTPISFDTSKEITVHSSKYDLRHVPKPDTEKSKASGLTAVANSKQISTQKGLAGILDEEKASDSGRDITSHFVECDSSSETDDDEIKTDEMKWASFDKYDWESAKIQHEVLTLNGKHANFPYDTIIYRIPCNSNNLNPIFKHLDLSSSKYTYRYFIRLESYDQLKTNVHRELEFGYIYKKKVIEEGSILCVLNSWIQQPKWIKPEKLNRSNMEKVELNEFLHHVPQKNKKIKVEFYQIKNIVDFKRKLRFMSWKLIREIQILYHFEAGEIGIRERKSVELIMKKNRYYIQYLDDNIYMKDLLDECEWILKVGTTSIGDDTRLCVIPENIEYQGQWEKIELLLRINI